MALYELTDEQVTLIEGLIEATKITPHVGELLEALRNPVKVNNDDADDFADAYDDEDDTLLSASEWREHVQRTKAYADGSYAKKFRSV